MRFTSICVRWVLPGRKKLFTLRKETVFDVQEKRKAWENDIKEIPAEHFVFLDESGVNTNLTRRYAWGIGKERIPDSVPLGTPKSTTVLSSIRLNGQSVTTMYQGGTSGDRFVQYLKNDLLPTLQKGDIVVMDNMRSHHVKAVAETFEATGIKIFYLPPYSPDFNPIEKMWSKMKSILRKLKIRSLELLPDAVIYALSQTTQEDCLGWFRSCGYAL